MNRPAVGVANNGQPIYNVQDVNTWTASDGTASTYHFNRVESETSPFALGNVDENGIQ